MRVLRAVVVTFVVVFLLAPLVVIAVGSVNQNRYLNFPPEGFSLSWYAQLFTDSGLADVDPVQRDDRHHSAPRSRC